MRRLLAIFGLLAVLLALGEPVAALAAAHSCPVGSRVVLEELPPCAGQNGSCSTACPVSSGCQNQCPSSSPLVSAALADDRSPILGTLSFVTVDERRPDTSSPVDSPPPRI